MIKSKILNFKFKNWFTIICGFLFAVIFSTVVRAEAVGVTVSYNGFEIPDVQVTMYANDNTNCTGSGTTDSSGVAQFTVNTTDCDVNSTTFIIDASLSLSDGTTQTGFNPDASLQGGQDFYSFEVVLQAPSARSSSSSGSSGSTSSGSNITSNPTSSGTQGTTGDTASNVGDCSSLRRRIFGTVGTAFAQGPSNDVVCPVSGSPPPLNLKPPEQIQAAGSLANYVSKDPTIKRVWRSMLALTNIVVVLILLAVAFATIFHIQVDTYGVKKVLPTLIVGVILANLSLLITRNIIDFASVLTATFANAAGGPQGLIDKLSKAVVGGTVEQFSQFISSTGGAVASGTIGVAGISFGVITGLSGVLLLGTLILVALLFLAPAILFAILAFLLYARTVIIVFLVAVAPLAFITMAFAPTQGLFRQWWTQFLRWVFMAPAVFFFLWLATEFNFLGATSSTFATYALSLLMVYLAIQVPFKLGGAVMSVYGGVGKKVVGFAGSKGSSYFQGLAERSGIQTPRALLKGWQQRGHHMEERFLTERSAEAEGGFSKRLGTGERGLFSLNRKTRQKAREFAEEKAENRMRALKRQQLYKEAEIFAHSPEQLEKLAEKDERFKTGDGASVIADLKQRSGKSTAENTKNSVKGILDEGDKANTTQAKQQANNDVSQLLRQILTAIRTQVTNKEYDKALEAYLGVIASDEKLKDRGFDPSTISSFKDLEEYDSKNGLQGEDSVANRFKQGIVTELGMRESDLENMSGTSMGRFKEFAGSIDKVKEWINTVAPKSQQGPSIELPKERKNLNSDMLAHYQEIALLQRPSSDQQAVQIAINSESSKEIITRLLVEKVPSLKGRESEIIESINRGSKVDDLIASFNIDEAGKEALSPHAPHINNVINLISNNDYKEYSSPTMAIPKAAQNTDSEQKNQAFSAIEFKIKQAKQMVGKLREENEDSEKERLVSLLKSNLEGIVPADRLKTIDKSFAGNDAQLDTLKNAIDKATDLMQGYQARPPKTS